MKKELPIYKASVLSLEEQEQGVFDVALVASPAMLTEWLTFEEIKDKQMYSINEEMQVITAPVIISGLPIYRKNSKGLEYYVVYEPNDVINIAQKFGAENRNLNVKLTHDTNDLTSDAFIFESFVSDEKRGISQPKGFDLPNGTWFVSMKIKTPELWSRIKSGEFKGISLEGFFELEKIETLEETDIQAIVEAVIN